MPESALLIPVAAAEPFMEPWQRHEPVARQGMPPHVTVLYPFIPPDRLEEGVLDELQTLIGNVDGFDYTLSRLDRFPGVLYMAPEPTEPFVELTRLVAHRWPDYPPYEGSIPLDRLIPHLTITDGAPLEVMDEASAALADRLPIEAEATEVWLMTRFSTRWNLKARLALS